MSYETRQRLQRRLHDLKTDRTDYEDHWRDLADYVRPDWFRNDELNTQRGQKNRKKIKDNTAGFALRTLQSGMHSGITSPSRPWFRLTTTDPELKEAAPIREWLNQVEAIMRETFSYSNVYRALHTGYGHMGLFGQQASLLIEDPDDLVHMLQLLHGEFWLATDPRGRVDTLYRMIPMTAEQMVRRWGDRVSNAVRNMYDRGNKDERIRVYHAVEPRLARDPRKIDKLNKPFSSIYWEDGAQDPMGGILEEGGYDSNPILAPRWEVISTDVYGLSPGMDALPDIKALQVEQVRKLEAIDKMVRPPMKGPNSLRNSKVSLLPGSITYVDDVNGASFEPAMNVALRIAELGEDIRATQDRISQTFYADLFMMISQMEGIQPRNQFEIAERKEEKLLMLGPVLESLHNELLQPLIDRTFEIMTKNGMIPPAPPELAGTDLQIEFISILAQAQKAVATGAIERTLAFAGNLVAVFPSVVDKIDADQAIDEYADLVGAPPGIVVPDERVEEIRKDRAEQAQQQQMVEGMAAAAPAAKQAADAAKVLSETPSGGGGTAGSLLNRLGLA